MTVTQQPPTGTCFYCGKPLDRTHVEWTGTSVIHMHLYCTMALANRLLRSVRGFLRRNEQ